jgi:site-specific DNA recombinase
MVRKVNKRNRKGTQAELGLLFNCTALYVCVSTQLQTDEAFSLAVQQDGLQTHCTAQGWPVCPEHIYIDVDRVDKTIDRPQFNALMTAAQAGQVQRIVALKLDRIVRDVREFLTMVGQLQAWGCDLVLVQEGFDTSTPSGHLALTMFAAMATLDATTTTERVMTGKAQKARRVAYSASRCPFGYDYANGALSINEEQAQTVRAIFAMFLSGKSFSEIAMTLHEAGIPTARAGKRDKNNNKERGARWHTGTVRYIVRNDIYAGVVQGADQTGNQLTQEDKDGDGVKGTSPPAIIDKATYQQTQRRLQSLRPGIQLENEIAHKLEHLAD